MERSDFGMGANAFFALAPRMISLAKKSFSRRPKDELTPSNSSSLGNIPARPISVPKASTVVPETPPKASITGQPDGFKIDGADIIEVAHKARILRDQNRDAIKSLYKLIGSKLEMETSARILKFSV